jgi:hypothetical protein
LVNIRTKSRSAARAFASVVNRQLVGGFSNWTKLPAPSQLRALVLSRDYAGSPLRTALCESLAEPDPLLPEEDDGVPAIEVSQGLVAVSTARGDNAVFGHVC